MIQIVTTHRIIMTRSHGTVHWKDIELTTSDDSVRLHSLRNDIIEKLIAQINDYFPDSELGLFDAFNPNKVKGTNDPLTYGTREIIRVRG